MLVAQWQRCGASVLFVTHDLREALALADRICFLSPAPGRVVLESPVDLPRPRDAAVAGSRSAVPGAARRAIPELLGGLATCQGDSATQEWRAMHAQDGDSAAAMRR